MKTLTLDSFTLLSGQVISPVPVAWYQWGRPPQQARHVYVVLHGISASPQALAGGNMPQRFDAGWFSDWAGPGLLLDSDHDCILAPNTLGSCFGTASPALQGDPASFPYFTIADAVALHGQWLKALGVALVRAVIGYSYGGYQTFQWALNPPVPAEKFVALASAPRGNGTLADAEKALALAQRFPAHGVGSAAGSSTAVSGHAASTGSTQESLLTGAVPADSTALHDWQKVRVATLTAYGYADWLQAQGCPDIPAELAAKAQVWAQQFSPWSMAYLRHASALFNVENAVRARRSGAPLLWMVNTGDRLFPQAFQADTPEQNLHTVHIDGRFGHGSPLLEAGLWLPHVERFLRG